MIAYTIKRILLMVPTLLGITLVTFFLIRLAPGDPVAFSPGGAGSADGGDSSATDRERVVRSPAACPHSW